MKRTRIKICGITRPQDAVDAASLGVDAIGLVFYEKSPRHIELSQAQAICSALPAFVTTVALFFNPDKDYVNRVTEAVNIDLLQFHGTESAAFCESFGMPYIKALGVQGVADISDVMRQYPSARSILLDSHAPGEAGGSGKAFGWHDIPPQIRRNIILAGGLKPENVAEAMASVQPYALDLSSGVESAPGIKDYELMTRLMNTVKRADCENMND